MAGILDSRVAKYLEDSVPPRGSVLDAMEREAKRREIPIVGPQVGRVLAALAAAASAKRVFELGSAIGYSTLWLAEAARTIGGAVTTVEQAEYEGIRPDQHRGDVGQRMSRA